MSLLDSYQYRYFLQDKGALPDFNAYYTLFRINLMYGFIFALRIYTGNEPVHIFEMYPNRFF